MINKQKKRTVAVAATAALQEKARAHNSKSIT